MNAEARERTGIKAHLGDRFDHGIMSYHLVAGILESVPPEDVLHYGHGGFRNALAAIAKHNLHDEPLSFRDQPIAAMLVLCDELQDWGRPRWDSEAFASQALRLLYFAQPPSYEPRSVCRDISVLRSGSRIGADREAIVLDYADPIEQRYDPWALVVCKLAALQRLSDAPRLRVILRLPRSPEWERLIGSELLRSYRAVMREFVGQFDHPILRREVLRPALPKLSPVRWITADDPKEIRADLEGIEIGHEAVIVDLEGISQFRPVLGSVDSFFSEFEQFMKRLFASQGRTFLGLQRGL